MFDGDGVKADVDFGPTLMLNRNRCILCTRCVRFMREVDGDAQIDIIDRGNGSEIATFQEEGVHSLISGNLMDVCPVGAITTRDYRFKSRPWDNPNAADTICTLCSKGCNTTAWLKAKPEWAKGSRLIRMTPRFNPDVNGYWMCDIGRFEYHWIEGDDRLRKPLVRAGGVAGAGGLARGDVETRRRARAQPGASNPDGVRFLLSAHASHEELFLFRRLAEELIGDAAGGDCGDAGAYASKPQPPDAKFKVPAVDAPNVNGATDIRSVARRRRRPKSDRPTCRRFAGASRRAACRRSTFSIPVRKARSATPAGLSRRGRSGTLPLLIVQGVLMTDLARAADFVLPGASSVEKEASYTNEQGRLQGTARAIPRPARRWRTGRSSSTLAPRSGVPFDYTERGARARRHRRAVARRARRSRASRRSRSRGRCGAHVAAGVESVRALEVGFHVPGSAAGEGRRRSDFAADAAGGHSASQK